MEDEVEIIVFGYAIVNCLSYVPRLALVGETIHCHKFETEFNGKAGSQCSIAARLGAHTALVAKLGNDDFGTNYLAHLQNLGVNTDFVEVCPNRTTGAAQILIADNGEHQSLLVMGTNSLLSATDGSNAIKYFKNAKVLLCQLEVPNHINFPVLHCFKGTSILSAGPTFDVSFTDLIKFTTIFCCNAEQVAHLIGKYELTSPEDYKEGLNKLLNLGAKTAIITLGVRGSIYATKEPTLSYIHVPIRRGVVTKDSFGASDGFVGALAMFIVRYPDSPLHQQIGGANDVASYAIKCPINAGKFNRAVEIDLNKMNYPWKKYT